MEWVETTGRSVDEAKEAALDRLGVDESEAEIDVIDEPRFGLFGRLRSEARIRARVRPTAPRPKLDRRDRRRRRRADETETTAVAVSAPDDAGDAISVDRPRKRQASEGSTLPAGASTDRAGRPGGSTSSEPRSSDASPRSVRSEATSTEARIPSPQRAARLSADRRNGTGVDDRGGDGVSDRTAPMRAGDDHGGDGGTAMEVSLEEQGDLARQFLDGLLDEMDLDAQVDIKRIDEETIELRVHGSDLGLLIGSKGTTLVALQDLTRTVVQRRTGAGNGRLLVDVSGYRQKRKEALERFARQLADDVRARGTRKVLEPMSAADRKIVHDTVNALEGVATASEGEEPNRRVIIIPSSR